MFEKTIPLTKGLHAIVDEDDYERLACFKWTAHVGLRKDGTVAYQYGYRQIRGADGKWKFVSMHRFILGAQDGVCVDHRNRNGLDNRKENLRECSKAQNCRNHGLNNANTSGFTGVYRHKRKWTARITVNYQYKYLGLFHTKELAAEAYDRAAITHFGAFAVTNVLPHEQARA